MWQVFPQMQSENLKFYMMQNREVIQNIKKQMTLLFYPVA